MGAAARRAFKVQCGLCREERQSIRITERHWLFDTWKDMRFVPFRVCVKCDRR